MRKPCPTTSTWPSCSWLSLLSPLLVVPLVAFGCGGDIQGPGGETGDSTDPGPTDVADLLGDSSFTITSGDCPVGQVCLPDCVNNTAEDVCGNSSPPGNGGCWLTGGGWIDDANGRDNFGGNGMSMKDGSIRGEWEHVDTATGDKYHFDVTYLLCRQVDEPGPGVPSGPDKNFADNQTYFGGPGRWFHPDSGWEDGYWFDIMFEDHGEPGNQPGPGQSGVGPDEYYFVARQITGTMSSGSVVAEYYSTGAAISGGNLQLHPPNNGHPYTTATLPDWVDFAP